MKRNWSLTSRLSIVFAGVMMSVWLLSSALLVTALDSYFRNQDLTLLNGKLELATELLEGEFHSGRLNNAGLARKLADAMVGHSGLYLSVRTADNRILTDYVSPGFPVPEQRFAVNIHQPGVLQTTEDNGWRYNVIVRKVSVPDASGQRDMLITAAYDTSLHDAFIAQLKKWLIWFNGGLIFISILLGWIVTRIGLRPLNEPLITSASACRRTGYPLSSCLRLQSSTACWRGSKAPSGVCPNFHRILLTSFAPLSAI